MTDDDCDGMAAAAPPLLPPSPPPTMPPEKAVAAAVQYNDLTGGDVGRGGGSRGSGGTKAVRVRPSCASAGRKDAVRNV